MKRYSTSEALRKGCLALGEISAMANSRYWRAAFTGKTWMQFLELENKVYAVNRRFKATASKIHPGDNLICYVAGISRFIGLLEATSSAFYQNDELWETYLYPVRVSVKPTIILEPETAVPASEFRDRLTVFKHLKTNAQWSMSFRVPIVEWNREDSEIVIKEMREVLSNPITRPYFRSSFNRDPY